MARLILLFVTAAAVFASIGFGQQFNRRAEHPPDIFDNRGVDVVRLAGDRYVVEMDNQSLRVLRVKLPAANRVPIHRHRSGIFIALTPLHLLLTAPDGTVTEIRLPAGDMRWIDNGIHAAQNAGAACEYLFVESKG